MDIKEAMEWADKVAHRITYNNDADALNTLAAEVLRLGENAKLRIDELDRLLTENEGLKDRLAESIEANANCAIVAEEVEQLRVQLAGCGVAAMANTRDAITTSLQVQPGDYGYSASYSDVMRAVTAEVHWRERAESAEAKLKRAEEVIAAYTLLASGPEGVAALHAALQRYEEDV